MKQKLYILISFILLSGMAFGQEKMVDSLEIKRIDSLVNATLSGSTFQRIKIDSITLLNQFAKQQLYSIDVYLKDKEIVGVSISEVPVKFTLNCGVCNGFTEFFINKGTLININENYSNCSRMGSCGCLDIENKLYYKEDKLLGTVTNDLCYRMPVATDWLYNTFMEIYAIAQKQFNSTED